MDAATSGESPQGSWNHWIFQRAPQPHTPDASLQICTSGWLVLCFLAMRQHSSRQENSTTIWYVPGRRDLCRLGSAAYNGAWLPVACRDAAGRSVPDRLLCWQAAWDRLRIRALLWAYFLPRQSRSSCKSCWSLSGGMCNSMAFESISMPSNVKHGAGPVAHMLLLMCNNCGGIVGSQEGPPGQNRQCSGICVQHLSVHQHWLKILRELSISQKVVWYRCNMIPASTCWVAAYLWDVPEPVYVHF